MLGVQDAMNRKLVQMEGRTMSEEQILSDTDK